MISTRSKFLCALVCALFAYAKPANTQATELFISEYIEGSSNNKAIEIFNGTGADVNLAAAGYNIQMFFNGNPVAALTINLTGSVAHGGVYVLAQSAADAAILAVANQTNGAGWFNGDDAVVLRKGTTIVDSIGQAGFDPGSEWGSGLTSTADNTLRRKGSVTAGDPDHTNVFDPSVEWDGFATNTFDGLGGFEPPPPPPPPALLEIHDIQGPGLASPHAGKRVETLDNIVTALTGNGFFMQTTRVDDNAATSEGVFVFTSSAPTVQVGDQVDVLGTVVEFFNLTEISAPTVTVDSHLHDLPAPVMFGPSLPSPVAGATLEHLEGMLVRAEHLTTTGPTDQFGDTPVVVGSMRTFREPGIEFPHSTGYPITWDGNPEVFEINADGAGLLDAAFAAGSAIAAAEGPLSFSFGDYQIWPTALTFTPQAMAPRPVRPRAAGEFTVAAQNLLRLFDTVNDDGVDDESASPEEFARRLAKASLHIREVLGAPDVLVMEEVENLGVAQALAARIAADDPALDYTAHVLEGHDIGGIDTGMLVRGTVAVSSVAQLGFDSRLSIDNSALHDRPPLVLRGEYIGNGAPFPITVIGVHNRSLSGIEGTSAGANRVRQKRLEQALEIAAYVQSLQSADSSRRIIVTGDFNAFEFSDGYVDAIGIISGNLDPNGAIQPGHADLVDPDLANQVLRLTPAERYSFVFEGNAQVLDHTLTSASLSPFVRDLMFSRGNADAPGSFSADASTALRTSDHDGAVLFVMTDRDADGLADDADACVASSRTLVTVGTCTTTVPDQILTNGCSLTDTLANLAAASTTHGGFVSEATQWLTKLRQAGVIDNKQRGEIVSCAARR